MTKNLRPDTREEAAAKIPALHILLAMGWRYLAPAACLDDRGSTRVVLLEPMLREWLAQHRFDFHGEGRPLSDNGVEQVVRTLTRPPLADGLLAANQALYRHLTFGVTVTEFVEGQRLSVTVPLADWANPDGNSFVVTEELSVERSQGRENYRPDIVCYVNGLPLAVIEAKRPESGHGNRPTVDEGISQHLRNQKSDGIQQLYAHAQLLLSISGNDGRYGTTNTEKKFWAAWREEDITEDDIRRLKDWRLPDDVKAALFADRSTATSDYFDTLWAAPVAPTDQDRLLVSLLRPDRLLEFCRFFLLFDRKAGKIAARYQQAFGTKRMIRQIKKKRADGGREGGVIWHTTGSGKSFSMIFLAKALLQHPDLADCRLVVVTDRVDLEKQLSGTFISGGAFGSSIGTKKDGAKAKASSGRDLALRISEGNERIIFTLLQKFASATKLPECRNLSSDIVVLIDEGHRSHGGETHQRMRRALPNAAYIAFTGTPLLKDDKTQNKFGPILHAYTMQRAVEDGTVTPLLYEERQPVIDINDQAIDNWFDKITAALSDQQRSDLKKKFATRGKLYGAGNRIELIAWDIAVHFGELKQTTPGLKGQLATDSKVAAIRYKRALDATSSVTSAVVISSPDDREGHDNTDESDIPEVQRWWKETVGKNEKAYEEQVVEDFASDGSPDILIVVDKLLTGFDEPRNTVLYIDKFLKDHNLLQAIARVNRLHEKKQHGLLIDYRGILKELDTSVRQYQDLAERTQGGYDIDDLVGIYDNVATEYKRLPGLHDALWAIFADVRNKADLEQYRQLLVPNLADDETGQRYDRNQKIREDFYEALTEFGMCLKVALESSSFFEDPSFPDDLIQRYKKDLKFFNELRKTARRDAQETVDFSEYESQITRLVDQHVVGEEIRSGDGWIVIDELGDGDPEGWSKEKAKTETDLIKTRIAKRIEQELTDDPYAQKVFSEMLRRAMDAAEALFDYPNKQYLMFRELDGKIQRRETPTVPDRFGDNHHAKAYYGAFRMVMGDDAFEAMPAADQDSYVEQALYIDEVVRDAVATHSINPQNIEAEIRNKLLPKFFNTLGGLDNAKALTEQIIEIVRQGAARER